MTTIVTFAALLPFIADADLQFVVFQGADDERSQQAEDRPDDLILLRSIVAPTDLVDACFGEAGTKGIEAFAAAGVVIDKASQTITFTTEGLKAVAMIPYRVMMDYDSDNGIGSGVWEEYGLGGDDDVDYWGGYLTPIIDALYAYAQSQGIPVLTVTEQDYQALLKQ